MSGSYERIERAHIDNPHVMRYAFAAQHVPGLDVLDAACGVGFGARILRAGGARGVHGVDSDEGAIETARQAYAEEAVSFEVADCLTIEGTWDAVISIETVEHLEDGEAWVEHIARRLLRRPGTAVISTRVRHGGSINDRPANPYHVREWSVEEFRELLAGHFDDVDIYYQGFTLPRVDAPRLLRPILRELRLRQSAVAPRMPVLSASEWFTHYEFGPRYMVGVCRLTRESAI